MGKFVVINGNVVTAENQHSIFHDFTDEDLDTMENTFIEDYFEQVDYFDDAYCIYWLITGGCQLWIYLNYTKYSVAV